MNTYIRELVSNGNQEEQAVIRRWWHTHEHAKGKLVWEYHLEGRYADAIWFFEADGVQGEQPGKNTARLHPLQNQNVVLCEAKEELTTGSLPKMPEQM